MWGKSIVVTLSDLKKIKGKYTIKRENVKNSG